MTSGENALLMTELFGTHKLGLLSLNANRMNTKASEYSLTVQRTKLAHDSDVNRGSSIAEFSKLLVPYRLLFHSWKELFSTLGTTMDSL